MASSMQAIFKFDPATLSPSEGKGGQPSRRMFLNLAVGGTAGLVLGLAPPVGLGTVAQAAAGASPAVGGLADAFVHVAPDNTVTVIIKHIDIGQGAATGLATLVAEELDADWAQIRTQFAPSDPVKYKNFAFGVQGVGGSNGLANSYDQYRRVGATARAMLVAAAAKEWGVPIGDITVSKGVVSIASGKTATLGALAQAASQSPVPDKVALKSPDKFTFIGKKFARVDSISKTNGTAKFTIDQQMPGMLVAVMARPPRFGGTVASYYDGAALKTPGVVAVVQVSRGVAVIAKDTWSALQGREALKVAWDDSKAEKRGTSQLISEYKSLLDKPGVVARKDGDAEGALGKAAKVITADFEFPYLAHAPMEPVDCVVSTDGVSAQIWTGSQIQTLDHGKACSVLGLKPEAVQLHTVWAGGSFGRRAIADSHFVAEACEIAKAHGKAVPIKLIWTREDDIKGGYYRPLYVHRIRAALDKDGAIIAWHHRIVGQSIMAGTPFEGQSVKNGVDGTSVEGAANLPYAIPNMTVDLHTVKVGVPVLWWRSVGATHNAHATEHMIDILAREAGRDPVAFRLSMLGAKPRHAGALKLAAEKANWTSAPPTGTTRGVALHESFGSYVAQVAEITMKPDGAFKVARVVSAIDCGVAVNPDVVNAQVEGGVGYGLGAALKAEITLDGGLVQQANFDTYDSLRMSEMPLVESHIVPSNQAPTGVGEPGTPVVMPAVANALLSASGQRSLRLPLVKQSYKTA